MPSKKSGHKLIWDEGHWLNRAGEARTAAENIRNPECKRIMREIAESYDHLAKLSKDFNRAARIPPAPAQADPKKTEQ